MNSQIFSSVNIITEWLPVVAGIVFWKRLKGIQFIFFWLLLITSAIDLISTILSLYREYNIFLFNINYLIEFWFLTYAYHRWLTQKKFDWRYFAGAGIYTIYYILTTSFSPDTITLNTIGRIIQCLLIATYSASVLIKLSNQLETSFSREPVFWFATSSLILYSTELIIYCAYTIFQDNFSSYNTLYSDIWSIHSIFAILANFLYSIAFTCRTPISYRFQLKS